ncbi:unnamed protein product [Rotaria sp. Silwood2]|nr:unnamed protein product [Rotaria sp. Silwood2]
MGKFERKKIVKLELSSRQIVFKLFDYAFKLYDFDKNEILTKSEIETIIKMILSLRGEENNDRLKDNIIKHLNRFINKFDENYSRRILSNMFTR